MALPDSTWRAHPFRPGAEYEARETSRGLTGGDFLLGKRYALRHVAYSHYDNSTVFCFQDRSGEFVNWWWHDDEPNSLCANRFRLVAEVAGY